MKQSKTFASGFPVEEAIETLRQQLAEKDAEVELERTARQQLEKLLHRQAETISASQAREQQLLKKVENYKILCQDENHYSHYLDALEALALPQDTAALEAMIAKAGEVMRERCAKETDALRAMYRSQAVGAYDGTYDFKQIAAEEIIDEIRAIPGVTLEDLK